MSEFIFVNPGTGNEPYILGSLIASQVVNSLNITGKRRPQILIPNIYGERQRRIIGEHLTDTSHIILDEKLGEMCKALIFRDSNYRKHLDDLLEKREEIQKGIRRHIKEEYGLPLIEVNTSGKVTSEAPKVYVFPVCQGELLKYVAEDRELVEFFGEERVKINRDVFRQYDEDFLMKFIPTFNTLSFDASRVKNSNEIGTPPLKGKPQKNLEDIPESIYCMSSGTGSEVEEIVNRGLNAVRRGIKVFAPYHLNVPEFEKRDPSIITNDNIRKVIARAGWGTIWSCQMAGVDLEVVPYTKGDDPEVYFNIQTLKNNSLREATQQQRALFGDDMDGISFVAREITGLIERL